MAVSGEPLLEHRALVLRLCRLMLRNATDAEDAAQQVFLHAYRALRSGVRPINERAWLAQIARNECRSRRRTAAARPESPLPEEIAARSPDPAELAAEHALVEQLRTELADLPERQREAVLLREFRGLSYDEVAAEMAETQPAVESLLQRARRRLVARLEGSRRTLVTAVFARLLAGGGATEAVATGGTAAIVGKVAAVGLVAVAAGNPATDVHRALSPPVDRSAPTHHVVQTPVSTPVVVARHAVVRHVSHVRHTEQRGSSPSSGPGSSAPTPEPDVREVASVSTTTTTAATRVDNSGPGSISSGSSGPGHDGSFSSGSGSGESGGGDD